MTEQKCDYAQCCNTLDSVYKIYCLRHPINNNIFYIGMTIKQLDERLYVHITELNSKVKSNKAKINYIQTIVDKGKY